MAGALPRLFTHWRWGPTPTSFPPFLPLPPYRPGRPTGMFLVPQELFVSAGVDEHVTMSRTGDLNYFRRQALDKVSVVRHEHERAAVVDQGVEQHFFRVEIEMVRRFVQEENI